MEDDSLEKALSGLADALAAHHRDYHIHDEETREEAMKNAYEQFRDHQGWFQDSEEMDSMAELGYDSAAAFASLTKSINEQVDHNYDGNIPPKTHHINRFLENVEDGDSYEEAATRDNLEFYDDPDNHISTHLQSPIMEEMEEELGY
jgi:hypothetical protein